MDAQYIDNDDPVPLVEIMDISVVCTSQDVHNIVDVPWDIADVLSPPKAAPIQATNTILEDPIFKAAAEKRRLEYLQRQKEARHAHIARLRELDEHHRLREARFLKIAMQQQAAQYHASLGNEEQYHVLASTTMLPQQPQHVLSPPTMPPQQQQSPLHSQGIGDELHMESQPLYDFWHDACNPDTNFNDLKKYIHEFETKMQLIFMEEDDSLIMGIDDLCQDYSLQLDVSNIYLFLNCC